MKIDLLFILTAHFLDVFMQSVFSVDPSMQSATIIFHFTLSALLLVIRKSDRFNACLLSFFTGCMIGYRAIGSFWEMGLIFLVTALILKLWFNNINESFAEFVVILISAVFMKEIMLFAFMRIEKITVISFGRWLLLRCIPTLLGNILPVSLMIYLDDAKDTYMQTKEAMRRRDESLFFKTVKIRKNKR